MSSLRDRLRGIGYRLGVSNSARADRCIAKDARFNPPDFQFADQVLDALDDLFSTMEGSTPVRAAKQRYKLVDLDRLLRKHKPRTILEIGSGATTAVFANYAEETGARFISVDESEVWSGHTRSLLDSLGLGGIVEFRILPKRIDPGKMEARYEGLPAEAFDFVLIDGPALEQDGVKYYLAVCADIFDLPRPKVIAVDMRRPTVDAIWRRLGDKYRSKLSDILGRESYVGLSYFSVFERNS